MVQERAEREIGSSGRKRLEEGLSHGGGEGWRRLESWWWQGLKEALSHG